MSLEAKLEELTAAVSKLTAVMEGGMSSKTTTSAKEESDKPTTTRTRRTPAKDKAPSTAEMKKAGESFLDKAGNDEDDYNDRRAHIKKVTAKFEAPKFSEIAEDDRKAALEMLASYDDDSGDKPRDNGDDDI